MPERLFTDKVIHVTSHGYCTLERSNVDLPNAQVTFASATAATLPGFVRWEPREAALPADVLASKHHPKYVFTYVARGTKQGRRERASARAAPSRSASATPAVDQ